MEEFFKAKDDSFFEKKESQKNRLPEEMDNLNKSMKLMEKIKEKNPNLKIALPKEDQLDFSRPAYLREI